jgi:hypothetical protein
MRPDPEWWTPRAQALTYAAAAATYIGFGMFHKWLLNWIVGPLWVVAFVVLVPATIEAVRQRYR